MARGLSTMEKVADDPAASLVDQAYSTILDALCDGTFEPGDRLTQEGIAARLNVSRQPVTHALAVLKAQGFVEPTGRRGLTVTAVEPDFFQAIYQFRSAVEPLAVSLATQRLSKADIARGRALVERGRALVAAGDPRAVLQADMDYHAFLYEMSGNPIIRETMRLHWLHVRRGMGRVLRAPGMSASVWAEHGRILERMVFGDVASAADLMRRHIVEAYERIRIGAEASAEPA